jgi:hypothetical protein
VLIELGRRRHRRMTLPAGLLLFICLFLPAVDGCGQPVYPIETPYFWHPYLYGGAVAIAALAATVRGVRMATLGLRILAWFAVAGGCLMTTFSVGFGAVETVLGGALLAIIGTRGGSEKRIAVTAIVMSVLSLLWFGLWAGSAGALIGVYLSLGASIFLLAGSLFWLSEI